MTDRQLKIMTLLDDSGLALRSVLFKITMSEQVTGDLMQDLFIRLYESQGFAQAKDGFAYAWRAAINLGFDWKRRQAKQSSRQQDLPSPPPPMSSPLEKISTQEEIERILYAVGQLPEPGRSVIIQRYLEQLSYEEIAVQLKKNPGHIRSICSKTIDKLRHQFTKNHPLSHQGGAV